MFQPFQSRVVIAVALQCLGLFVHPVCGSEPAKSETLIGYTKLQTNLSGGRHANVRTMRAVIMKTDGSGHRQIAEELVEDPNTWTQFAGWSPNGQQAIVYRGWQDPKNAKWEEANKTFRMLPGKWKLDACLVDVATGKLANVTDVERVSHYNGGLFFLPDGRGLGFTPLIKGVSKPYIMDLDGRNKRDVSGNGDGFAYGYSASPDGKRISYHENYQIYVADADGTNKRKIETGNAFNFAPTWSPDGQWLLFVSGKHYDCHPTIVRRDGSGLRKLADRAGYRGVTAFLDVFDFHGGSSDTPIWAADGKSVFFTAKVDDNVELFSARLDGSTTRLTKSKAKSLHYHPKPSADGLWLLYGSKRDGVRQLFLMDLKTRKETQLTRYTTGHAAIWPHWRPAKDKK